MLEVYITRGYKIILFLMPQFKQEFSVFRLKIWVLYDFLSIKSSLQFIQKVEDRTVSLTFPK